MDEKITEFGRGDATFELVWNILYYTLALLGLVTNVVLFATICTSKAVRKRSIWMFIWSIALWHLVQSLLTTPQYFRDPLYGYFTPIWLPPLCQARWTVLNIAFNMELHSLLAIGLFYGVTFVTVARRRRGQSVVGVDWRVPPSTARLCAGFVWFTAISLSVPWGSFRELVPEEPVDINAHETCEPFDYNWLLWYTRIVSFCANFVLVLLLNIIFAVVGRWTFRNHAENASLYTAQEMNALVLIVVKVDLCWILPWIWFVTDWIDPDLIEKSGYAALVDLTISWIHNWAPVFNVFILGILVPPYRRIYRRYFCCKFKPRGPPKHPEVWISDKPKKPEPTVTFRSNRVLNRYY